MKVNKVVNTIMKKYIYMFLKPANSDMENGFKKNSKMSPEKIHIQRKLETGKDTF